MEELYLKEPKSSLYKVCCKLARISTFVRIGVGDKVEKGRK